MSDKCFVEPISTLLSIKNYHCYFSISDKQKGLENYEKCLLCYLKSYCCSQGIQIAIFLFPNSPLVGH